MNQIDHIILFLHFINEYLDLHSFKNQIWIFL